MNQASGGGAARRICRGLLVRESSRIIRTHGHASCPGNGVRTIRRKQTYFSLGTRAAGGVAQWLCLAVAAQRSGERQVDIAEPIARVFDAASWARVGRRPARHGCRCRCGCQGCVAGSGRVAGSDRDRDPGARWPPADRVDRTTKTEDRRPRPGCRLRGPTAPRGPGPSGRRGPWTERTVDRVGQRFPRQGDRFTTSKTSTADRKREANMTSK